MRRLKVSVLTLVRNRETHLNNLIEGLCHTIQLPDELVIVRMNESPKPFLDLPFDCRQITLSTNVALPLAKARNRAAQAAKGDFLIFLDVDCIPGQSCINEYLKAHALKPQAVLMGAVYYLHRPLPPKWIMGQLRKQSSPHPARHPKDQTFLQTETNYNLFWTLSFGISRQQFAIIGGFCESYRGYGAEDTDFARMMERRKIELCWVPTAKAYHQYHDSQVPPYAHLESIVENAQVYRDRWGQWPMEKWLAAFAAAGYIDWRPTGNYIRQLRPSADYQSSSNADTGTR